MINQKTEMENYKVIRLFSNFNIINKMSGLLINNYENNLAAIMDNIYAVYYEIFFCKNAEIRLNNEVINEN